MFSAIPYQEQIEVKRSNLCWLNILFDFLRFRSLIFYIYYWCYYWYYWCYYWCYFIYIIDDINTSLEISWTLIVAHKNIERKNPENSFSKPFQFFVITSLWCKIFEIIVKCSFSRVFGHIMWRFVVHYPFLWKIVVPQSQNFFFSFYFFLFFIFLKNCRRHHLLFFRLIFPFFHSSLY